jgi:hypothetical protein
MRLHALRCLLPAATPDYTMARRERGNVIFYADEVSCTFAYLSLSGVSNVRDGSRAKPSESSVQSFSTLYELPQKVKSRCQRTRARRNQTLNEFIALIAVRREFAS